MARKIASIVYLLTGVLIGLGAFGHGAQAGHLADALARSSAFDSNMAAVLLAVWYFVSGCMLVFGAVVIGTWWRVRKDGRAWFFASDAIGVFYVIAGVASVIGTGKSFFWVFTLFGALLLVASLPLRRGA